MGNCNDMSKIRDGILGVAIGDILGVPVEFTSRRERDTDQVTGPRGGGPNDQPLGVWSDDTSMTLCLAEALIDGYDLTRIAQTFLDWKEKNKWTSHGYVFDIWQHSFHCTQ